MKPESVNAMSRHLNSLACAAILVVGALPCTAFAQSAGSSGAGAFQAGYGGSRYTTARQATGSTRDANGNPGQPQKLADYIAVSEDKLKALSPEKLAELRDNGALGQIYAHLTSLLGWDKLIALAFQRANAAPAGNA